jgi:hypothetical protein
VSYQDVADMAEDWDLRMRLIACVAQEHRDDPVQFVEDQIWRIAGQPGWGDAWNYAKLVHENDPDYHPGKDAAVLTDGMILAGVQQVVNIVEGRINDEAEAAQAAAAAAVQAEADRQLEVFTRQREYELANPIIPVEIPAPPPGDPVVIPGSDEPVPGEPPPATGDFQEPPQ